MTYTYLYGAPEQEGTLIAETPTDAVMEIIDVEKNSVMDIPRILTISAYRHEPVSEAYRERLAGHLLEMALESLNEEYGHLDFADTPDDRMRESARTFADTLATLFPATTMHPQTTFEVVVPRERIITGYIEYRKTEYKRRFGVEFGSPLDRSIFSHTGLDGERHAVEIEQDVIPSQREAAAAESELITRALDELARIKEKERR